MLNDENISLNFKTNMIDWSCKSFHQLSEEEITSILEIRSRIFNKKYLEKLEQMSNVDQKSLHFFAFQNGELIAYNINNNEYIDKAPYLNFWRAPIDNDYGNKLPVRSKEWKIASHNRKLKSFSGNFKNKFEAYPLI